MCHTAPAFRFWRASARFSCSTAHAMKKGMRRITLPVALLTSLGIVVLAVAVLYAMGRPPICKCGYVRFWGPPDSQHLFDAYTFTHMLHAPFYYLLIWLVDRGRLSLAKRLLLCVTFEAGWEIFENTPFIINRYRAVTISRDYFGDSIVNSMADITAMIVGFLLAARLPAWVTVALLIAVEVTLVALIRDNLILNIIMLMHPSDWLRQWQAGG